MKKALFQLILFSVLTLTFSIKAQTIDEVLNGYYKAYNYDKLTKIQTVSVTGKILQGGAEIPYKFYQKRPNKMRMDGSYQGISFVSTYNGLEGWTLNPFAGSPDVRPMNNDELIQSNDRSDIDGFLYNYEQKGYKLELLPDEVINGTKVYVIDVTKPDSTSVVHYINAENSRLIQTNSKMILQGMETEIKTYLSDYRTVDDLLYPFAIENNVGGQTLLKIVVEEVQFDKDLDDNLFEKPEIKKE